MQSSWAEDLGRHGRGGAGGRAAYARACLVVDASDRHNPSGKVMVGVQRYLISGLISRTVDRDFWLLLRVTDACVPQ